ncbi:MAG: ketose-bisphosphate aldolase [Friedmanniella sp.]|nr:ketose-bisphosphate aldolase [Friedmanniella sp.]
MPLTTTAQLTEDARAADHGVCAFNVITLESAEAVVSGAETAGQPVILQLSENATRFHRHNPRPLAAAMRELAVAATVPVALHLDHVEDEELLHLSAAAGFSSVMFDAGRLPYSDNLAATRRAATWAHAEGLSIEAELGYVGGKDTQASNAHTAGVRTDPEQAREFVAATGVDALAVAVGSSHAMHARTARLDDELIRALAAAVPVPLVLHGSSGVGEEELGRAVASGMTKINVGTILSIAYTRAVRGFLAEQPDVSDPRRYLEPARAEVADVVAGYLRVVGRV